MKIITDEMVEMAWRVLVFKTADPTEPENIRQALEAVLPDIIDAIAAEAGPLINHSDQADEVIRSLKSR